MATITRGLHSDYVLRIKSVLDEYEHSHPGAVATLYEQNPGSIRVRIVDERFKGLSKGQRHDEVWDFIADRLSDDDLQEISVLLPLPPSEQRGSILNAEFDQPTPSHL